MQRLKNVDTNQSFVFDASNEKEHVMDSEIGKKWGFSRKIIVALCEANKIPNCMKMGNRWLIPAETECPDEEVFRSMNMCNELTSPKNNEEKEKSQRLKSFNGLTAKEWTERSRSVWNDVSSAREKKHLDHGATFPLKLCNRLIEIYSKKGDTVLDPFLGTGTTVLAALGKKRNTVGIELTDRFFDVAIREIYRLFPSCGDLFVSSENTGDKYSLFKGDCSEVLKELPSGFVQLTVTSPPYADLIHKVVEDRTLRHKRSAFVHDNNATTNLYSVDERDLGNMPLDEYLSAVDRIMVELFRVTKTGGYNIWVVKDFRDTRNGIPYIDLHTKIAESGERAGFRYHDLIVWDQNEQRRLVLLGYPSVFYVNQNHSYMVVLKK